ncbi:MAG: hypothetical protein Q9187_006468 [Circinaria calcarea]
MPSIYQLAMASILVALGVAAPLLDHRQQTNRRDDIGNAGLGNNGYNNTGNNNNGYNNIGNNNNGNNNMGNGNNGNFNVGNGQNGNRNGIKGISKGIKNGFNVRQQHNPKFVRNGAWAYAMVLAKHKAPATKIAAVSAAASTGSMGVSKGSVAAKPQPYDSEYLSPVTIGNQNFTMNFDTGSSDL